MKIDDLQMTIRSSNALQKHGVESVEDLLKLSWKELEAIKNLGEKSLSEICWSCVQLSNGQMLNRIQQVDEWRTSQNKEYLPFQQMLQKSRKYDKIKKIINE